jgi:spore coat polysaccharide biosynthesis protein SpsF (cytidylyltransferase family)
MAKSAVVICSRVESKRLPHKPLIKFAGVPAIEHLISRLIPTGVPIVLAVPYGDLEHYSFLNKYTHFDFTVAVGSAENPLERMAQVAFAQDLDVIIRITHDKLFIDTEALVESLKTFNASNLDYLYSGDFICGAGFEIISRKCLERAYEKFQGKMVEHISYAVKLVSENSLNIKTYNPAPKLRLLLDYPQDKAFFDTIFTYLPQDCTLKDVVKLSYKEPWLCEINKLPDVTIYTCGFNAETTLQFKDFEYLLIDDGSSDRTSQIMSKAQACFSNIRWIKNAHNVGLASSSNIALSQARAPYIIRIDADDFFASKLSVLDLLHEAWINKAEVVYPDNYFGSYSEIQKGNECHHVVMTFFLEQKTV